MILAIENAPYLAVVVLAAIAIAVLGVLLTEHHWPEDEG